MTREEWLNKTLYWKQKWPVPIEQGDKLHDDQNGLNLYRFIDYLNNNLQEDSVVVSDAGSSLYICGQGLQLSQKRRWICSWAQAEMGAAIGMGCGVCFARDKKNTIVVTGDGSLNTQIHSLATVRKHNLPIKIFILQNQGFLSIKNSMDKFYEGRRIGTSSQDGYFFPEIVKIAAAYEIDYLKINKIHEMDYVIRQVMDSNQPCIIEVVCQEIQEIYPSITAFKNKDGKMEQHDFSSMTPFLSEEEYKREMIKI